MLKESAKPEFRIPQISKDAFGGSCPDDKNHRAHKSCRRHDDGDSQNVGALIIAITPFECEDRSQSKIEASDQDRQSVHRVSPQVTSAAILVRIAARIQSRAIK